MTPKSYADVFIYIAAITGLAFASGWAVLNGGTVGGSIGIGAVFGIAMAVFGTPKLVGDTQQVPVTDATAFVPRLNIACAQMGYQPEPPVGNFLQFNPTSESSFSIGFVKIAPASYLKLGVQVEGANATIIGPHAAVTDLRQRLLKT